MASTKTVLSTAASLAASAMLVRTIVNEFLPHQFQDYIFSATAGIFRRFSSQLTLVIQEYDGFSINQMYKAAEVYLGSKICPSTRRLRVHKEEDEKGLVITMERGEEVTDLFQGVHFTWQMFCRETERATVNPYHGGRYSNTSIHSEVRSFELTFHKKHKDMTLNSYLSYILAQSKIKKEEDKALKIHTGRYEQLYGNMSDVWFPVNLDHPATFDKIAMEPELKQCVMEDLERFVRRKEYYKRVGKAWKRGYLLFGPPGTGKSSLIAAMANYLNFDIYDLELTEMNRNSDLRIMLMATANRSIVVVEDIDCTIQLEERKEDRDNRSNGDCNDKVTLSGLLNFIDGLWSSCGDERIIVFTTNHKERLDPALLRPGRMDMHIHMSYCTPNGFKVLASNYHGIDDHPLYRDIEDLMKEVEVTPAEVAEELMKSDNTETALLGLIKFLQEKKMEASKANKAKIDTMGGHEHKGQEIDEKEEQKGTHLR